MSNEALPEAVLFVDEKGIVLVRKGDGAAVKALFDAMDKPLVGKKCLAFVPATTISAQEEQIERLTKALEPFAGLDMPAADKWTCGTFLIEHDDIRRARAAIEGNKRDG